MERFNKYIEDAWTLAKAQYQTKKATHLNACLGNVSGDMDSVVCSILLGYYLTYKQGFYEEEKEELDAESISEERLNKFSMPMINMNQIDLKARSDIIHHLENLGIDTDKLPACDVIDLKHYADSNKLKVNLLDHNIPDYTQDFLIDSVVRLIDHHQDKGGVYPNLEYRDVRFCGSAASLVIKLMTDDSEWKEKLIDKHIALLAAAPMLLDTSNFSESLRGNKWDQVDEDQYKTVKEIAGDHIPADYHDTLYHKKIDLETNINLGFHLLARKDYKNFKINDLILGISTIFLQLKVCDKEFTAEEIKKQLNNIVVEKNLDMYMVLTDYKDAETDEHRRQILTFSPNEELSNKLKDMLDNFNEVNLDSIKVGELNDIKYCHTWQNHSTSYSRKKFEPLIRNYFEK